MMGRPKAREVDCRRLKGSTQPHHRHGAADGEYGNGYVAPQLPGASLGRARDRDEGADLESPLAALAPHFPSGYLLAAAWAIWYSFNIAKPLLKVGDARGLGLAGVDLIDTDTSWLRA